MAATSTMLPYDTGLPQRLTGCVSELSCGDGQAALHGAALRDYAAVYGAFQAYLTPRHDCVAYGEQALLVLAEGGAFATESELPPVLPSASDEDVESCGYFGWLCH